jgi:secreted trypsin-like serine protease
MANSREFSAVVAKSRYSVGRFGIPFLLGAGALLACGSPADAPALVRLQQPILGGAVDTEHPEVMLLLNQAGFLCTGTVIHVEQQRAFLLTAAHCVTEEDEEGNGAGIALPPEEFLVVPGADFAESTTAFSVDAIHVEPDYDGTFAGDDIAVVRFFFGAEPAPSVIPPLLSNDDELGAGSDLLLVGYGQTETDPDNTRRRHVQRSIQDLDESLILYTQQDAKGACFGDSGGPALIDLDGEPRVAAIISGGVNEDDTGCAGGVGVAMRVSAYEDFIRGTF